MTEEPGAKDKKSEIMGFARPINALWLLLLFVGTWLLWSLRAAVIILVLFIIATVAGVLFRKNE